MLSVINLSTMSVCVFVLHTDIGVIYSFSGLLKSWCHLLHHYSMCQKRQGSISQHELYFLPIRLNSRYDPAALWTFTNAVKSLGHVIMWTRQMWTSFSFFTVLLHFVLFVLLTCLWPLWTMSAKSNTEVVAFTGGWRLKLNEDLGKRTSHMWILIC